MADLIADAMTWQAGVIKEQMTQTVVIRRLTAHANIQAIFASQVMKTFDGQGNTKIERPDGTFIIRANDYNFGSGVVEPMAGDIIEATYGTAVLQFKLMPMGHDPCFRFDPFRIMVHCFGKYIGPA